MKKFPSKNLMDSSKTSFYKHGNTEESKAEKALLIQINNQILASLIPDFSKSRLQKLVRFLLNGNMMPENPQYIELQSALSVTNPDLASMSFRNPLQSNGMSPKNDQVGELEKVKTPEFNQRIVRSMSNHKLEFNPEDDKDEIQTYSDSEVEDPDNSISDVSQYQNNQNNQNVISNMHERVKKQIQSTGMGASMTKFSNMHKLNKLAEGFKYLFEEENDASNDYK